MTLYDLGLALKRYRRVIFIAFSLLFVIVMLMTFTIRDGKPAFRATLKYDSGVQIAVVAPGTDSLITGTGGSFAGAASLYASLLGSSEAADWIGDENGFKLESAVDASTERNSSIIIAQVTGPTPEQARGAALSTFDWLSKRLLEPIETSDFPSPPTTVPQIVLDGPFSSFTEITIGPGLEGVDGDLFLFVDIGSSGSIPLPLQQSAGTTVRTDTTLEPLTTVVLTLSTAADEVLDTIRLAPEPLPRIVDALPELFIDIPDGSVQRTSLGDEGGTTWTFNSSSITLTWEDGAATASVTEVETASVDLALLTPEPGFTASGGRRGPILAIAALLVGAVLILTGVIVADTWRRERDARRLTTNEAQEVTDHPQPNGSTQGRVGTDIPASTDIEVQTTSLDS
ncbi:MAG: hypothetical protein GWP18_01160 [Proteobacteria bacterium]|nr:hypothetical protein [Pseudomonadota bacterium]